MKVKSESEVAQSCPTRQDPMDCSLPGSSIHGILQARVLEWVSIPTLKPSSTQEPRSFTARHTILILQQNRNTTLNIKRWAAQSHAKPIDIPKLTTGHFIALYRGEIQLHPSEHRHKFPQPGNPDKPLV